MCFRVCLKIAARRASTVSETSPWMKTTSGVGVSGYSQFTRTVRVTGCATLSCAGVTGTNTAHMLRRVGVTVTYTPLTAAGGQAPAPKTVYLEWLVSQK